MPHIFAQNNQPELREKVNITVPKEKFHLYLLIGQSNMAGRGIVELEDTISNSRILRLNPEGEWEIAKDPLHFDKPNAGVGPGLSFAREMLADSDSDVVIGLIPCAAGGSGIDIWENGKYWESTKSYPYDDALKRTAIAMKSGVLKAILWHQGESDNTPEMATAYMDKLSRLVNALRKEFNLPDIPFVAGELASPQGNRIPINDVFHQAKSVIGNYGVVSAKDMVFMSDNIHLDSPSQRIFGKRYAETLREIIKEQSCSPDKIRIACVGNSITYGSGIKDKTVDSYPAQLSFMLGEKYDVRNFGVGGANMLRKGKRPYWNCEEYKNALEFQPDWVFIKLGTNDSRTTDQIYLDEFVPDYKAMIQSFRELPSSPKVVLLLPVPVFGKETQSVSDSVITKKILPMIRQVAYDAKCEVLNLYNLLIESPELFNEDLVHPAKEGATVIAQRVYEHVKRISDPGFQLSGVIPPDAKPFNHFGFQGYEFQFRDRTTRIVLPKVAAPGHLWIFRTAHWYGEPQTDIALLEKGFHFVHCDVAELFGNDEALSIWNDLYLQLQKAGLAQKPVMEGMSRGGVYVYRWAAKYPERVAAIYADAPVLDLKSWPGGGGKRQRPEKIWETFKKDFGLKTDEEAMAFKGNPIDLIDEIVAGGYPMLHIVGDKDITVPVNENTEPFEKKIKAAGGVITVIHKKETGHHPHSLANPKPIVDFLLKATEYWETQL